MIRAVTITDGATCYVDRDDLLTRRLEKSIEQTSPCPVCNQPSTEFVTVREYGFGGDPAYGSFRSARCTEHGAKILLLDPAFKGMQVGVEMLGKKHWMTYVNGVLQKESFGQ